MYDILSNYQQYNFKLNKEAPVLPKSERAPASALFPFLNMLPNMAASPTSSALWACWYHTVCMERITMLTELSLLYG